MTRYEINYLTGDTDYITADTIEPMTWQYIAYRNNSPIAWIPNANVRSIICQDSTTANTPTTAMHDHGGQNLTNAWTDGINAPRPAKNRP